jgi:tRNA(Ile)-lysidine synthase
MLAVSGGPDSTALMWLAARWRKSMKRGPKLIAATVDHGLRKEAKSEALAVNRLARALKLEHRTLRWTGPKPSTGVQEAARNARYRLLADAARKAGGAHLITAHTRDDQAETVLFRLLRGSGIGGLAGMRMGGPLPFASADRLMLFRPLLDIPKSRLVATLRAANVAYADDPSNRDPRFARPRLRELMPLLAEEGLSAERLTRLAARAARAEIALHEVQQAALRKLAPGHWPDGGPITLGAAEFYGLPDEIALRVLDRIVSWAGNEGPVELGKLEVLSTALLAAIEASMTARPQAGSFRRTLAGAVVTLSRGQIRIERAPPRRTRARPHKP